MIEFCKVYTPCAIKHLVLREVRQANFLKSTAWASPSSDQNLTGVREDTLNYLFDRSHDLNYKSETSHCAAALFDAFLSRIAIKSLGVMKLVGLVCLMLASKQLEVKGLTANDVRNISKTPCATSDIITLERFVIVTLDWNLNLVTAAEAIRCLLLTTDSSRFNTEMLAKSADSYASFCYANAELTKCGPIAIAIGSVWCAFNKMGFNEYAAEWLIKLRDVWQIDTQAGTALGFDVSLKIGLGCIS